MQVFSEFTLRDAAGLVPYLASLGISHLYLSPVMQAALGSTHGYDVVDPTRVNEELGGQRAFDELSAAVQRHGMGLIVDIVPNHMAITGRENKWWWDVLRHGRDSEFAKFFDIDWASSDQIVLPVLGDHYGRVLERGELQLREANDGYVIQYFDNEFPVDPATLQETDLDVDELDVLIGRQHYRLAYWRVSRDELDYRRFFDIDSLIALRNEDADVFDATHYLINDWLKRGTVDGVRVDHIDGLRDPLGYLRRLRAGSPSAWIGVEKILEPGESLPSSWPVQGTTGYDAARIIDGLFIEPDSEQAFAEMYRDDWESIAHEAKKFVVENVLGSDVARLVELLSNVCKARRRFRDFTRIELRTAIEALLVSMPVYRTYVVAETGQVTESDIRVLENALDTARKFATGVDSELFDLLRDLFRLQLVGEAEAEFVMKFQQVSGPVRAKSIEDTAFYRFSRFVALNEVGNDPSCWSVRPDDFHEFAATVQRAFPKTMIAGSTHDSKRSADVRARLAVLSEIPGEWRAAVERWTEMNEIHKRDGYPDRSTEYLIYQTLVGAFPLDADRATEYILKATREAKLHTSWTAQNEIYEAAVENFVRSIIVSAPFSDDLAKFVAPIVRCGRVNSLSATVLRATMPGVADCYQGDEFWNLALVDPDNRRPVDFDARRASLDSGLLHPDTDDIGVSKQHVLRALLNERIDGEYIPIFASGSRALHVISFRRGNHVVIVPRLVHALANDWDDTTVEIDDCGWRNVITNETVRGGRVDLASLLERFPVAVLGRNDA